MLWSVIGDIFFQYKKKHLFYVLLNIIFIIITVVNNFYLPKIYGNLYETFQKDTSKFISIFTSIVIIKAIVYIFFQLEDYYYNVQKVGIEEETQKYVVSKIREQFINHPEEVIIGEKLSSMLRIQRTVANWYLKIFEHLVPYIFVVISSSYFMWTLDKYLPLCILILLSGTFISIFSNISLCKDYSYPANQAYLKLYQEIEDYLSNIGTIYTYNQFGSENDKIKKYTTNYQNQNKLIERCSLTWHLVGVVITITFLFITMYYSYHLLNKGYITKSNFISLYFIVISMLGSLIYLSDMFHDLTIEYNNLKDIENITKLNLFKQPIINKNVKYPKLKTDAYINVVNLDYKYLGTNTSIIEGLNLEIKEGEKIALIGDIGSGKSTLLKIILGLIKPSNGDLYLKGINYKSLNQSDIFKTFGYMTQNPILFNRSILDNILFSNPNTTRKEVEELLKVFKLDIVFNKLEKGIDSDVGKNGSKLSGGQRQVVWFLRIYLHNPDILLLDEPTASMSIESKEIFWNLIKEGFKNKTIIMASHDDFLIKLATRKIVIKKNQVKLKL
jgi:ATP-binding cassette subfamily C protein LapB